jgi:hypothetical protein
MKLRSLVVCWVVVVSAALPAFAAQKTAPAVESTAAQGPALNPADILGLAVSTVARAESVKAAGNLEAWYPFHYSSALNVLAARNGDERVEMTTTMKEDTVKAFEVISGGILWTESQSPTGPLVTKVDLNEVKKSLAAENKMSPALPLLGTNALFDLANLSKVVAFTGAYEQASGARKEYVLVGSLKSAFTAENPLPLAAQRFYKSVIVAVDAKDFFPRRIELGREDNHPLLRLEFTEVEMNAALPQDAFKYTIPEGADVVDRTAWTLSELGKGR